MTSDSRSRNTWLVPVLLIVFALFPLAIGVGRMAMRFSPTGPDADTGRFFSMPWAVVLHLVGAAIFTLVGAWQFSPGLRRTPWHRRAGRLVLLAGIMAASTGLWLTQFYPHHVTDGPLLYWFRLAAGSAMLGFLVLGYVAATRRQIPLHRASMIRAYALGIGASTQMVVAIAYLVAFGPPPNVVNDLLLGSAWLINLGVAELAIRRVQAPRRALRPA